MAEPSKFTPEVLAQIKQWIKDRDSPVEIAKRLGTTVGSLKVTCSKHGLSLDRVVVQLALPLPRETYRKLSVHALLLNKTTPELIANLLCIIAEDNMYNAILDE